MKKMKFVTKGLALLMMGVMLAGCSDKATDASESTKQESVSNDKSSEATSSEVATGEASGSEATSSEATSSEATSSEASSSEATSTETSSEAQGQTGSVDDARITQYEEYFKNFSMDNKLFSMHLEGEEDGVKINFDMKFGAKDGNSFLQIAMPGQGDTNSLTAYFMKDNSAYMELKVAGSDPVMQKTTGMDSAVAEELNPGRELVNIGPENNEDVKLAFVREETIDGVAYDVLKPVDSDEALVYMNQKTKEWEKMMAKADGQEVLVDILPADDFSLPASYATADEVDSETFTMTLAFGMIGLMAGGQ